MLAEALMVATSSEERQLLIDAARGRLWATHNPHQLPYGIRDLSRMKRWALRMAFEGRAAIRSDIRPLAFRGIKKILLPA